VTFYVVLIFLLVSVLPPAAMIVIFSGARSPRRLWQHADVLVALGVLLDAVRRLANVTLPPPYGLPLTPVSDWFALFTFLTLGVVSLGLWAQATRMIRHHYRNADLARQGRELRAHLEREQQSKE
jgi:hypothetical protein